MSKIKLTDVAEDAGVSRSTVSLVMQESPLVAEATRQKVKASAKKLGYIYNRAAASLRSQMSGNIGVIISSVSNPFFAEIVLGLEKVFGDADKTVLLGQHSDDLVIQEKLIVSMLESGADGVILVPAYGTEKRHVSRLINTQVPTIFLNRKVEDTRIPYVGSDTTRGAELAVDHLLSHGVKKIVIIGGRLGSSALEERVNGARISLSNHGIAIENLSQLGEQATRKAGYESAILLAKRGIKNVGILAYNDIVASGAISALHEVGIIPGKDVPIIGIDDVELAQYLNPPLTTIHTDPQGIGVTAGQTLLSIIKHQNPLLQNIILSNDLSIRQSCGCAANSEVM
jgi:LacI family transcriptional regulator